MPTAPALLVPRTGDASVLTVEDRDVPAPAAGEVQVRVAAAGVNFIDVYQRQGVYPLPTPFVLGSEGAGVIEVVGDGVDLRAGARVAWASVLGSAAGLANVPAALAVPVPEGLALDLAAAAMLQGMTAHYLVTSTYAVQPGDTVLVHAAAGGVGQLLIQLCKARGATVIGTVSTDAKADKAKSLGADHVIDYSRVDDVAAAVRQLTAGQGVAVVYDGVGRSTFEGSLASLRVRGMLVLFGGASGQVPPFDLQRLNQAGSVFVTRPKLGDYMGSRDELEWRASEVLGAVGSGALRLEIGGRYPLADAAAAYRSLEGRETTGKLLLLP